MCVHTRQNVCKLGSQSDVYHDAIITILASVPFAEAHWHVSLHWQLPVLRDMSYHIIVEVLPRA